MADFEWDPEKESFNLRKHGIDFTTALLIWENPVYERADKRRDYGESRFVAFGTVVDHVLAIVYTPRGEARRIISARKANAREKVLYETEIGPRARPAPSD
jgi:uncharacterized DUF497 family protein